MRFEGFGALLLGAVSLVAGASELFSERELSLSGQRLWVEVASTPIARQQGLMGRKGLPDAQGMLLVFDRSAIHCLWMKDTVLPLSAVFITDQGQVLNRVDLTPYDLQSRCSNGAARFALEVNRGWFERHSIDLTQFIEGLPEVEN